MKTLKRSWWLAAAATAIAALAAVATVVTSGASAAPFKAARPGHATGLGQMSGLLPRSHLTVDSALQVDLTHETVRLPLYPGIANGKTVWYVLLDASDAGLAHDLGVNYAPKLANIAISDPAAVQTVTLDSPTPQQNPFGPAIVHFAGAPDFSPTRIATPGPNGFPLAKFSPGAVAGPRYSPFIRIAGSGVVYSAPIVATGDGPFDVVHHTNTGDRVLGIHIAGKSHPGQFAESWVDLLFVKGFDAGQPIVYISTDAGQPLTAVLERSTYVPALNNVAFNGGDDFLGSARERLFGFVNGQAGAANPQAQGFVHLVKDGHADQDASAGNTALIDALRNGGDLLNVFGDFPTLADPRHADAYSPLWDAQLGLWTDKAVKAGLNTRQIDENVVFNLAATRPDLLTGVNPATGQPAPYGSQGVDINCAVIGYTAQAPTANLVPPAPNSQFPRANPIVNKPPGPAGPSPAGPVPRHEEPACRITSTARPPSPTGASIRGDFYVFPAAPGTTAPIVTVNPDAGRSSLTTFRPDALYEFVVASDGGTREDITFRVSFADPDQAGHQKMRVLRAEGPAAQGGTGGIPLGEGRTGQVFSLNADGLAWAGRAQDPFTADGASLAAFLQGVAEGTYRPESFTASPANIFAGRDITAIALQVPDVALGGTRIAAWARISLAGHAPQQQVSRIGQAMLRPLFFSPPDVESETLNAGAPATDQEVHGERVARIAGTVARLAGLPNPEAHAKKVMAAFLPDVVLYRPGTPARFEPGGGNGRALDDDGFDIAVGFLAGSPLGSSSVPRSATAAFPYLLAPQPADLPALADLFGLRGQTSTPASQLP